MALISYTKAQELRDILAEVRRECALAASEVVTPAEHRLLDIEVALTKVLEELVTAARQG